MSCDVVSRVLSCFDPDPRLHLSTRLAFRKSPVPGAVGFGLAAVESAAASVVALTSVRGFCCWWVWLVVRLVCVPLCVRESRVSRVCPGSPRVSFYR